MTYNLFIDDMRQPADVMACWGREWVVARSLAEVMQVIETRGAPAFVSFDHDMTEAHYGLDYSDGLTGADIAAWIASRGPMPRYQVHSLNPEAVSRIADAIR